MLRNTKKVAATFALFLFLSFVQVSLQVGVVEAESTIYVRTDGNVVGTDKIRRDGNVYTFLDSISDEIVVEKDNIVLDGAGYSVQAPFRAIVLLNQSGVTIKNLKIKAELNQYGYAFGIVLTSSCNNTIVNNELIVPYNPAGEARVTTGIFLEKSSNNNIISNNTLTSINDNGIYLGASSGNTITNNILNGCGISSLDSAQKTVANNTADGKPIIYLEHVSGYAVEDAGQVILVNCSNITVSNLVLPIIGIQLSNTENSEITKNEADISLYLSSGNTIIENKGEISLRESEYNNVSINTWWVNIFNASNNIISGNMGGIKVSYSANVSMVGNSFDHGIWLQNTVNCLIDSNNITGNGSGEGICLSFSFNNTIVNNIVAKNTFGFYLRYTADNIIIGNNIVDNKQPVANLGSLNSWDNGTTGNYWSDYPSKYPNATKLDNLGIWDTPYEIIDAYNLTASSHDNYPLMNSVDVSIIPEFPSWLIFPLFLAVTLVVLVYRKKLTKKGNPPIILGD